MAEEREAVTDCKHLKWKLKKKGKKAGQHLWPVQPHRDTGAASAWGGIAAALFKLPLTAVIRNDGWFNFSVLLGARRCRAGRCCLDEYQNPTSCRGRERPSGQAHGTARARASAVLTAHFSANWTQRAWHGAATGKCLSD